MRSMEFTLTHSNHCTLTEQPDLSFFSLCLLDAWKYVLKHFPENEEDHAKLLAMQCELFWYNLMLRKQLQGYDPYVPYFNALFQCADKLKTKAAIAQDYRKAYCTYLYSVFLFTFIYLVEEKRWKTLAQFVNHVPSMPQWDKEMDKQYTWLRMLAILVCVCEGNICENRLKRINYSVLQTIPYYQGMDLLHIREHYLSPRRNSTESWSNKLYETGWIIYRECFWKEAI